MEKSYNILVIGNGFDLAHGLPTTYNDFLEFAERVIHIFEFPASKSELDYQHSCQTAYCRRCKPHFNFGESAFPIVSRQME